MKTTFPALLVLALSGAAMADIPKKAPETRYTSLWMNSPFTTKPVVTNENIVVNPLEDYALIGVSSIGHTSDGKSRYRVTMISKKSPDERIYVESGVSNKDGFKINKVVKKNGNPLATTVEMASGSKTGTLKFDEKLLTLSQPAVQAPPGANPVPGQGNPNQPQAAGQQNQQQQQNQQTGQVPPQRQPRARVVPPPNVQQNQQGQGGQQFQGQGQRGNGNGGRSERRRP